MADLSELLTTIRKTRGAAPPALVGASVTLVEDAVFVFGGRVADKREMTSSLFRLDLQRLEWTHLSPSGDPPRARYFHAATAWGDKLVVHGGQSLVQAPSSDAGDCLEVLDTLSIYDTVHNNWSHPAVSVAPGLSQPAARFAHLAVVSTIASASVPSGPLAPAPSPVSSRLLVVGGQNDQSAYLADMAVLDLDRGEWIAAGPFAGKTSAHRSCMTQVHSLVVGKEEKRLEDGSCLTFSAHTELPTFEREGPAFILNHRRGLDVISSLHSSETRVQAHTDSTVESAPSLRFPSVSACGTNLVLAGIHLESQDAECAVWTTAWTGEQRWERLPLVQLRRGSWQHALVWRDRLLAVGDPQGSMLRDYTARQVTFDYLASVDLAGFGIYTPPLSHSTATQQQIALQQAAQATLHDFEIVTEDNLSIGCSRRTLQARWPWFATALRSVPGDLATDRRDATAAVTFARSGASSFALSSTSLALPLPFAAAQTLTTYLYTSSFVSPSQRTISALGPLLLFSQQHPALLPDLFGQVTHALHDLLTLQRDESAILAGVLEYATLAGCVALQVRASHLISQSSRRGSVASDASLPYLRSPSSLSYGSSSLTPATSPSLEAFQDRRSPAPPKSSLPLAPSIASSLSDDSRARATQPASTSISASTPAHIARAWREAEERDQLQRLEGLRIDVEADIARSAAALRYAQEQKRAGLAVDPSQPDRHAYHASGVPSQTGISDSSASTQADETASIRTSNSGNSNSTRTSSDKPVVAIAAVRAVKKGFLSSLVSGPTIHNAGVARAKTAGPAPKRMYPAPTPRSAKGSNALCQRAGPSDGSSASSVRS
ncbi:hypothetical protein JCM10908_006952 [Rhodotorula pacifica]|uniref:uncharacterized protein n=1 Tax=Rhodotorula pacifica TaxID=1495444 RepID=UPI003176EFE5